MDRLTLGQIAEVVGGQLADPDAGVGAVGPDVVIDSRKVTPGALFVAFAGDHVDGHDFIGKAHELGAGGALCQRVPTDLPAAAAARCVVVEDPTIALGRLARRIIDDHPDVAVIGVTGSQGKTSTKDLLAQVLGQAGPTVAPEGSFNNEIGVPLTATRVDAGTRHLVSEMGARGRHHIEYLCSLTPPRIGIVLNVGQAHVGEFGSREAIAAAKGELVEQLPSDGWAVLNGTDRRVVEMAARTRARVALFSGAGRPDTPADLLVWADDVSADDLDRHSFTLQLEHLDGATDRAPVTLRLVGRHHVANAAAAAAAAVCIGVPLATVADSLSAATPLSRWRMEVSERPDGVVVVNDAYNANPDSMLAACDTLARMTRRRRTARPQVRSWAILGQMFELGEASAEEHEAIGRAVGSLQIDHLISMGADARRMVEAARAAGCENATVAADIAAAVELVRPAPGDIVLVKASRAMGLEKVAEALVAQGSEASGEVQ
ncbi:UDP-N-acetylmuramoyl-tripeptide--D-alanyl-D-alanine ligase [Granulicoccus sp. GXG6511]|uniref:UDP-N-acetylmuramoyl-tripeptide--D-alanyl-D- alanine ligase n=1 Tax=Granulicoccus sp. GXG6511 TaxID=3381351 RepID=UPI003D7C7783